ncbi:MAG: DNA modification methylase [Candidatus Xenobia bacterium]
MSVAAPQYSPGAVRSATLPISSIIVANRHRKDLGDLTELAQSILEDGLLHLPVVTPDHRLVDGERRLRAVTDHLGWTHIDVRVMDLPSLVRGELRANQLRKQFTPSEMVAIMDALAAELATPRGRQASDEPAHAGMVWHRVYKRTDLEVEAFIEAGTFPEDDTDLVVQEYPSECWRPEALDETHYRCPGHPMVHRTGEASKRVHEMVEDECIGLHCTSCKRLAWQIKEDNVQLDLPFENTRKRGRKITWAEYGICPGHPPAPPQDQQRVEEPEATNWLGAPEEEPPQELHGTLLFSHSEEEYKQPREVELDGVTFLVHQVYRADELPPEHRAMLDEANPQECYVPECWRPTEERPGMWACPGHPCPGTNPESKHEWEKVAGQRLCKRCDRLESEITEDNKRLGVRLIGKKDERLGPCPGTTFELRQEEEETEAPPAPQPEPTRIVRTTPLPLPEWRVTCEVQISYRNSKLRREEFRVLAETAEEAAQQAAGRQRVQNVVDVRPWAWEKSAEAAIQDEAAIKAELANGKRAHAFEWSAEASLMACKACQAPMNNARGWCPGAPQEEPEKKRAPQTRDKVAAVLGVGARTLEKAKDIVDAAKADPRHQDLVDQMDKSGKINGPHKELRKRKRVAELQAQVEAAKERGCGILFPDDSPVVVLHSDAIELLATLEPESVQMAFPDIPYGIAAYGGGTKVGDEFSSFAIDWDNIDPADYLRLLDRWVEAFARVLQTDHGALCMWCDRFLVSYVVEAYRRHGLRPKNVVTWYKTNAAPNPRENLDSASEVFVWGCKGREVFNRGLGQCSSVWPGSLVSGDVRADWPHPTVKPTAMIEHYIKLFSHDGDLVVDPFCGSGTTAEAALLAGRRVIVGDNDDSAVTITTGRVMQVLARQQEVGRG